MIRLSLKMAYNYGTSTFKANPLGDFDVSAALFASSLQLQSEARLPKDALASPALPDAQASRGSTSFDEWEEYLFICFCGTWDMNVLRLLWKMTHWASSMQRVIEQDT